MREDAVVSGALARLFGALLALVAAVALAGCGNTAEVRGSRPADTAYLFAQLRQQQALFDTAWVPEDLADALPSKVHRVATHDVRASDEVVTGRFRSWTRAKTGITASFAVERVIDVREGTARLQAQTLPVRVQVGAAAEVQRMGNGLVALGPAILYLTAPSASDQRWSLAWNGQLVGPVDGTRVEAPAFLPLHGATKPTTLDALHAAANRNHAAARRAAPPVPTAPPSAEGSAVDLVPVVWRVRDAAGEADGTWLRVDGLSLNVLRPKGSVLLTWRPQGDRFVAQVDGWSMSLGTRGAPVVPWLTGAASFKRDGAGWRLRTAAGETTARLVRDGSPPRSSTTETAPPKVDARVRAQLADATAGPGIAAVDPAAIAGHWTVPGFDQSVALTFGADGHWSARTSCESGTGAGGGAGQFRLLPNGLLLMAAGPVAGVGCGEPKVLPPPDATAIMLADRAGSVLLDDDALTLFDRAGKRLGTLHRAG